MFKNGSDMMV